MSRKPISPSNRAPAAKSAGKRCNGVAPQVVARIFRDFVAGKTTTEIVQALNAEGVPAPGGSGTKWIAKLHVYAPGNGWAACELLPPAGTRVAIYSRCAAALDSAAAIETQQRVCRDYAESLGWEVVSYFGDANRSGRSSAGREGRAQLLAGAKRRAFEVVLVDEVCRLSRDAADLLRLAVEIQANAVVLCSVACGVHGAAGFLTQRALAKRGR
jgi:hypothetical protein